MEVKITCPNCLHQMMVEASFCGQTTHCSTCGVALKVPESLRPRGRGTKSKIMLLMYAVAGVLLATNALTFYLWRRDATSQPLRGATKRPLTVKSVSGTTSTPAQVPAAYTPVFFKDVNYLTSRVALDPGTYTAGQLQNKGIAKNSISSMLVPPGFKVIAYAGGDFSGASWTFTTNVPSLAPLGANDAINSLVVTFDTNAIFKIASRANSMAVDSGNTASAGATVIQRAASDGSQQHWRFIDAGSGYFKVVSAMSGLVVDGGGVMTKGTATELLQVWSESTDQQWKVVSAEGGYFRIVNRTSSLEFDSGGSVPDGSPLNQWTYGAWVTNRQWRITKVN